MDNLMERLSRNLKRIRRDRKIPYSLLERATGIRASRLREIEEGEQHLSVDELDRLLGYYRLNVNQVLAYRRRYLKWALPVVAAAALGAVLFLYIGNGEPHESSPDKQAANIGAGIDGLPSDEAVGNDGADEADGGAGDRSSGRGDGTDEDGSGSDQEQAPDGKAADGAAPSQEQGVKVGQPDASGGVGAVGAEGGDPAGAGKESDGANSGEMPDEPEKAPVYENLHQGSKVTPAPLPAPKYDEPIIFRVWGNIAYDADKLPELEDNDLAAVKHIIPVSGLSADRPQWLGKSSKDRYILSLANADIWSDTTLAEWLSLRHEGYPAIGLGRKQEAYEPYIVQVKDRKVGILTLAGLIHEPQHIAQMNWIGLPRAYDDQEVRSAVERAKQEVDDLIVIIHVGFLRGDEVPDAKQERLARVAAEAGADIVIGNRSLRSQQVTAIGGVPVVYSLGRSVSDEAGDGLRNYVLDIHYSEGIDKIVVRAGTMKDGVLHFGERAADSASVRSWFEAWLNIPGIKWEFEDRSGI